MISHFLGNNFTQMRPLPPPTPLGQIKNLVEGGGWRDGDVLLVKYSSWGKSEPRF